MKSKLTSRLIKALVVITVLGVMSANMSVVNAASKTITCYKGTAVKKVSAVSPVCPKGWLIEKPKAGTVALNATYRGTMELSLGIHDVDMTVSVTGAGTGTTAGLNKLSATGSLSGQQCDFFTLLGTLSGGGSTLEATFDSKAMAWACSAGVPNRDSLALAITANVTGGTGKFAGATGTLKINITGSLPDVAPPEGDYEFFLQNVKNLTIKLSGNIKTK